MNNNLTKRRNTLVLYTTAVCNLNCSYCYIDKNPALKKIDKLLEESYKEKKYYFDFAKKIFPDPQQLKEIQYWGGEPTLSLTRIHDVTKELINYYPNLKTFLFSTNFVNENWFEQVENFFNIFSYFPTRKFILKLQLSIDGPSYINDIGRGKNTTKKFITNLQIFLKKVKTKKWIPNNLEINLFFKPTLTLEMYKKLQTKQEVYNYYKFFDDLSILITSCCYSNFYYDYSLPTIAEPAPVTIQDGKNYAVFCQRCVELEKENLFVIYKKLLPYQKVQTKQKYEASKKELFNFTAGCTSCGIGLITIGLLPQNKISLCHNGFCDLLQEYKIQCSKNVNNHTLKENNLDLNFFDRNSIIKTTVCNINDLSNWSEIVEKYSNRNSVFQITNTVNQILHLAHYGMIDKKYCNKEQAFLAAKWINSNLPFCFRNNLAINGSMSIQTLSVFKLFLNGALDYIVGENTII